MLAIRAYTLSNASFDVSQTAALGCAGRALFQARVRARPAAPRFCAGADDGGESSQGAPALARRSDGVLYSRPISLAPLLGAVALLLLIAPPNFRKKREEVFEEAEA
jgi:TctA family transporter